MLRGLVENFYAGSAGADVVFDTSRLWCSRMKLLETLFPQAKVIACVRQLSWVLDSMERLVRNSPVSVSKVFRFDTNTTVYSRVEALTDPRGMVGFAFQSVKDAFYGQYAPGQLLLLTYESLVGDPAKTLRAFYQFIGEPWFDHDFDNIEYNANEFDERVGMPGLHAVRRKLEVIDRTPILPPEDLQSVFARGILAGSEKQRRRRARVVTINAPPACLAATATRAQPPARRKPPRMETRVVATARSTTTADRRCRPDRPNG